jgi:hypothetical protein
MCLLSKYNLARFDGQSHHLFSVARSPNLECRHDEVTQRQFLFPFNFHTL